MLSLGTFSSTIMVNSPESSLNGTDHNSNIEMETKHQPNLESFCIEKIFCYQLKNYLYVVGSSNCLTKHRVLKFDRRSVHQLLIASENRVLSKQQLLRYRQREGFWHSSKFIESTVVAFGIVGVVRFLEGYYIILIVKRRCVAIIGRHCVYKIEDTSMLYIPNQPQTTITDKYDRNEQWYLSLFNNVDLSSNFYFSYSYDLSNTLQVCS